MPEAYSGFFISLTKEMGKAGGGPHGTQAFLEHCGMQPGKPYVMLSVSYWVLRSRVDGMLSPRRTKTSFMKKAYHIATPLGWLLVYLILVQGTLPSLVLCFGSNGHIAIETPHSPVNHPTSQTQDPCLDVRIIGEKSEEQTLAVASGSALQALVSFLMHVSSTPQEFTSPPHVDALRRSGFPPMLVLTPLPPVILRI
jgi:hypothetical protein